MGGLGPVEVGPFCQPLLPRPGVKLHSEAPKPNKCLQAHEAEILHYLPHPLTTPFCHAARRFEPNALAQGQLPQQQVDAAAMRKGSPGRNGCTATGML